MLIKKFVPDYVCLDLETTGLSKDRDKIIEIAIVVVKDNQIAETYSTLINPGFKISNRITQITGITNEMLATAPALDEIIAQKVKDLIGDRIILGHNVTFDINFLRNNIHDFRNDHVDTLSLSRICLPQLGHHRLCDLSDFFKIETEFHRALSDVMTTISVFNCLSRYADEMKIELNKSTSKYRNYYRRNAAEEQISPEALKLKLKTEWACNIDNIPEDNFFTGLHVCFTGELSLPRGQFQKFIEIIGGIPDKSVTKKTNLLVIGGYDITSGLKGDKSTKHLKALKLQSEGQDIKILSEISFYQLIGNLED